MKTAMQELIDKLEVFKGMCKTDGEKFIINYSISNAKKFLEKEKEQIKDAFCDGKYFGDNEGYDSEQYYNETFKN